MSLLFMDGFDMADMPLKWVANPALWGYGDTPRFGAGTGRCVRNDSSNPMQKSFAASAKVFAGFAIRWPASASFREICTIMGDTGSIVHCGVGISPSGALFLWRGSASTVLATTVGGLILTGAWNYVELSATVADSGGLLEVRLNGLSVLAYTGDTKNGGSSTNIDSVQLNAISGSAFDDFYLCDALGSQNNNFLGDVRVQTLVPVGAGSSTQFTPTGSGNNWANVDESPYSATDYNSDNVSGHRDTYAMSDPNGNTSAIKGVQVCSVALKSDAGTALLKTAIKSGGTVYYGPDAALAVAAATKSTLYETDPATSAPWTLANVNALEAGVEIV